jgi:hypothetical protein
MGKTYTQEDHEKLAHLIRKEINSKDLKKDLKELLFPLPLKDSDDYFKMNIFIQDFISKGYTVLKIIQKAPEEIFSVFTGVIFVKERKGYSFIEKLYIGKNFRQNG